MVFFPPFCLYGICIQWRLSATTADGSIDGFQLRWFYNYDCGRFACDFLCEDFPYERFMCGISLNLSTHVLRTLFICFEAIDTPSYSHADGKRPLFYEPSMDPRFFEYRLKCFWLCSYIQSIEFDALTRNLYRWIIQVPFARRYMRSSLLFHLMNYSEFIGAQP